MTQNDTTSTARILLFTGNGKGKTTAGLGMVLRAAGHGLPVLILQFVKSDGDTGEASGCAFLPGVEIRQVGLGFLPPSDAAAFADHRTAAQQGLAEAREALASGNYGLVLLDEICVAVGKGLLSEEAVAEAVRLTPPHTCVVLTGRYATPGLLSLADTVTDMTLVKHGFDGGYPPRPGVEY